MNINFSKIQEIYGDDLLETCKENVEDLVKNINYLVKLGFSDVEDIFERYPFIFLTDTFTFCSNINGLVRKLGINYINILEENMGLWEDLI